MSNANTDVNTLTIYTEEYQQMINTLPRGPQLRILSRVHTKFREWLATQQICDTHRLCQIQAHYDRRIDTLILNDVFTPNMKTVWTLTEPYVGKRSTDTQIIQAREIHKNLKKIIHYIKEKLCKTAFAGELRARRESRRESRRSRRELSQAITLARTLGTNIVNIRRRDSTLALYIFNMRDSTVTITDSRRVSRTRVVSRAPFVCNIENSLRNITEEEADKEMEDDCAICASKHKMMEVCSLNCGHQFGMEDCLTRWINIQKNAYKHPTCPCCRTQITKIVENTITPIDL